MQPTHALNITTIVSDALYASVPVRISWTFVALSLLMLAIMQSVYCLHPDRVQFSLYNETMALVHRTCISARCGYWRTKDHPLDNKVRCRTCETTLGENFVTTANSLNGNGLPVRGRVIKFHKGQLFNATSQSLLPVLVFGTQMQPTH
jgi:hypothetical protein